MTDSCATKTCRRCGETKPLDKFGNDRSRNDGRFPWCKECSRDYTNAWRKAGNRKAEAYLSRKRERDKERRLLAKYDLNRFDKTLLKRYGATIGTYAAMHAAQDGKCAICLRTSDEVDGHRRLHLDHDHLSGQLRGLLCMFCNQGLGRFKDDPELLRRAIAYLEGDRTH